MCRKQNFKIVSGLKVPLIPHTAVLTFSFHFLSSPLLSLFLHHFFSFWGAVYKSGRGQGDGGIGMHDCVGTWELRTRDEGLEDIKYGTRGHVGQGRRDVKYKDAGCE